ncbi:MAG: hypothetical protein HZA17_04960 [Nitrospirae bacterium]|nr:hypothetical protein [Nitrospirota bacterium]
MTLRFDRKVLAAAAVTAACIVLIAMLTYSLALKKEREKIRAKKQEMLVLKDEYISVKTSLGAVEGRKSLTKVEGLVQAVDEILRSLGLNQKIKSVKPLGSRDRKYAVEEEAEVQVERLSMNELMNILYKIENAPMILSNKKTTIRTSFESPALLNMTMTISLIKPK